LLTSTYLTGGAGPSVSCDRPTEPAIGPILVERAF